MNTREIRAVGNVESRAGDNGAPTKITGYAAVFNSPVQIGSYFQEMIAPGAFSASIASDDIRALFNHNSDYVLGRNSNGSLTLREDAKGLYFEVTPPETSWARDLMLSIERGDISQMSFGFIAKRQEWDETDDVVKRTLLEVELLEVSPVTFPAYPDTSAGVRSLEEWRSSRAPIIEPEPEDQPAPFVPVSLAARMRMDLALRSRRIG